MTEESIQAKIAAAIIMRADLQKIADDEENGKTVRAAAAVFVMFISDVLPTYRAEADRQSEKIARAYLESVEARLHEYDARMKANIAAIKPYKDPYHI
jgi:hypothetical protein